MRIVRLTTAAVLLAACLLYIIFGQHKGWGIGAGVIVLFLCRFLVLDHRALNEAEERRRQRTENS